MGVRRYPINEDYFKVWSPNMAYTLGFFMADVCIYEKRIDRQNRVRLRIKSTDIEVVELVRDEITPTRPINMGMQIDKRSNNKSYYCQVEFLSNIVVSDLAKLGVISLRTGNEKLPMIPEKYKNHFLRGLIDGDGTINFNKKSISLASASATFLYSVKENLLNNYGRIRSCTGKNCNELRIEKLEHLNNIYHYLYDDGGFCLKRKKENFDKIVEHYKGSRVYKPEVLVV